MEMCDDNHEEIVFEDFTFCPGCKLVAEIKRLEETIEQYQESRRRD